MHNVDWGLNNGVSLNYIKFHSLNAGRWHGGIHEWQNVELQHKVIIPLK